jgi:tryptophan-rich sensory protein
VGEILRGRTIRRDRFALAGFLAACLAVSVLGGLVTASSVGGWYQALDKPPFNPPDWLFAPVWTGLYLMMALAAWRIWRHVDHPWRVRALALFAGQLALNLAWSFLFFGLTAVGAALVEIVVLWIAIVLTAVTFGRIDRTAGWLLAPYVAWVLFAAVLNAAIWSLN